MQHILQNKLQKEEVKNFGSEKTTIQWFRRPEEANMFMLRRFEIGPDGHIGIHTHPEEHQIYILKGPIILQSENKQEIEVVEDEFIYVPPNESHGYKNPNPFPVSFLCGIPKLHP
jgi:quercetin dioxygenase-like cupin family protein